METALDKFGRVLIPKKVRKDLGLEAGTVFKIDEFEHEIRLKPVAEKPEIVNKEGVLVFVGKAAGNIGETVKELRQERLSKAAGWRNP